MKILHAEMGLREETRGVEQAREITAPPAHAERAAELAATQDALQQRVVQVQRDILALQEDQPELSFPQELALLGSVEQVMGEAGQILRRPETGPEAIAAETEAIELLLQTRRIQPSGGGGGGSSPGGGGTGDTQRSALALLGEGDQATGAVETREVNQATGVSGRQLPAEFRRGLDAYFGALESEPGI